MPDIYFIWNCANESDSKFYQCQEHSDCKVCSSSENLSLTGKCKSKFESLDNSKLILDTPRFELAFLLNLRISDYLKWQTSNFWSQFHQMIKHTGRENKGNDHRRCLDVSWNSPNSYLKKCNEEHWREHACSYWGLICLASCWSYVQHELNCLTWLK